MRAWASTRGQHRLLAARRRRTSSFARYSLTSLISLSPLHLISPANISPTSPIPHPTSRPSPRRCCLRCSPPWPTPPSPPGFNLDPNPNPSPSPTSTETVTPTVPRRCSAGWLRRAWGRVRSGGAGRGRALRLRLPAHRRGPAVLIEVRHPMLSPTTAGAALLSQPYA